MTDRSDTGPFSIVPHWLIPIVSSRAIHAYVIIAAYADKHTGDAWPSRKTIGGEMGVKEKAVDRAIAELVKVGALTSSPRYRNDGSRSSNMFRVLRSNAGHADLDLELEDDDSDPIPAAEEPRPRRSTPPPQGKTPPGPLVTPRPRPDDIAELEPRTRFKEPERSKGAGTPATSDSNRITDTRPNESELKFADKLNASLKELGKKDGRITMAAIQRWNSRYGPRVVTDTLRQVHGFPPPEAVARPYAYIDRILKENACT